LISFLNAVLDLEDKNRVKDVTLLNPFQLPRIADEKSSIIDVRATDEKGLTFIVEMQVAEPAGFDKRVLYYTSKDYAGQINSGEDYPLLRSPRLVFAPPRSIPRRRACVFLTKRNFRAWLNIVPN
jgi:predicted transposase/invertase (TIGR01784 family)